MTDLKPEENEETQNLDGTGEGGDPSKKPFSPGNEALSPAEKKVKELEAALAKSEERAAKAKSDSDRGAEELLNKNKNLEAELAKANEALLEKELNQNPDYEDMTDEEKARAKADLRAKRENDLRLKKLEAQTKMREDYDSLPSDIRTDLETHGGFSEFKKFALAPENIGQKSLLNLAKQFLFDHKEPEPVPEPEPEPSPGLEDGTGGPKNLPPKKEGMTAEEVKHLRETNPKKYNELAREGKLKIID